MMHLPGLVLFTLFLAGAARRSVHTVAFHSDAKQHTNTPTKALEVSAEAREALQPRGFWTAQSHRWDLLAGALDAANGEGPQLRLPQGQPRSMRHGGPGERLRLPEFPRNGSRCSPQGHQLLEQYGRPAGHLQPRRAPQSLAEVSESDIEVRAPGVHNVPLQLLRASPGVHHRLGQLAAPKAEKPTFAASRPAALRGRARQAVMDAENSSLSEAGRDELLRELARAVMDAENSSLSEAGRDELLRELAREPLDSFFAGLRSAFDAVDVDDSGLLARSELMAALHAIGLNLNEVREITFTDFSGSVISHEDLVVTFDEFLDIVLTVACGLPPEVVIRGI